MLAHYASGRMPLVGHPPGLPCGWPTGTRQVPRRSARRGGGGRRASARAVRRAELGFAELPRTTSGKIRRGDLTVREANTARDEAARAEITERRDEQFSELRS
ncbi:hypothetical protein GCM10017788_73820 [Amycolatopsis acidiphila]|nr:hypothetical protein GCM10017788_73820 [Amycolatopsis acidiphila]